MPDIERIGSYLRGAAGFPAEEQEVASVMLSGSAGWGIAEGDDHHSDWDLHIILPEHAYEAFRARFGAEHLLDDQSHRPPIHAQFRSLRWLRQRLTAQDPRWWPLYLWIYEHGTWLYDHCDVGSLVAAARNRFSDEQQDLLREHFVRHCVRKCDVRTSTARGHELASQLYHGECIQVALEAFSLAHGQPYPYRKWLPKHVSALHGGAEFVRLCDESIKVIGDPSKRVASISVVEKALARAVRERIGARPWLTEWWKFNFN